jgi:hypothetical protein
LAGVGGADPGWRGDHTARVVDEYVVLRVAPVGDSAFPFGDIGPAVRATVPEQHGAKEVRKTRGRPAALERDVWRVHRATPQRLSTQWAIENLARWRPSFPTWRHRSPVHVAGRSRVVSPTARR